MARYPGALWLPLTVDKSRWRLVPLRVNLHVAVSEARSLRGYFNSSRSVPDSHFYIRRDGTVEQYVDTALIAYADLEGNGSTISIETQGGVTATQTEPWTPQQVEAMARLYAWAVKTHGIAVRLADDSKPGTSSHGLSWHRLGCDGNFPGRPLHGRLPGGRKYSRSFGKVCPGDAKIRQVPDVYARALTLLGATHGVGGITIPPVTIPEGHLDMHPDELNKHLSRHAENVVAALMSRLPGEVDEVVRKRDNAQNTSLHNMVRRELALAIGDGQPVDLDGLATRVAGLLEDDLIDAVTQVVTAHPGADTAQIKAEVREDIANRLTKEN